MSSLALNFLPSASVSGDKFVAFFNVYLVIAILWFVVTLGAAFYFVAKYRRRKEGEKTAYIPHSYAIEFASVFLIGLWAAAFFIWGWNDYSANIAPRMDEYEINVIGQQWSWQIQYSNGRTLTNELVVPRDRPVRLIMTSKDVIHSFFVPEFRIKQDAVPGQFTNLRFTANKTGTYHIFCAEYCGTAHSKMLGKVVILDPVDFQKWLDGLYHPSEHVQVADSASSNGSRPLADLGKDLFKEKNCSSCHSIDGSIIIGPSLKGVYQSERELVGGTKVLADENYLRESIMDPMKKIVKGFPPAMPTFRGLLSDEEVNQLVAYIKSLH